MRSHKVLWGALLLSLLSVGCSDSGYDNSGEKVDGASVCRSNSTAWIRYTIDEDRASIDELQLEDLLTEEELEGVSDEDKPARLEQELARLTEEALRDLLEQKRLVTELLILGHEVSQDDDTGADCFYLAQFDYEGSILLDQGDFVLDGTTELGEPGSGEYVLEERPGAGEAYRGIWTVSWVYDFVREPEKGILARKGAKRTELYSTAIRIIEFQRNGERLSLSVDGVSKEFHELAPLAASLDMDDGSDRRYLVRMLNLGLLTSQVRLIGFGSSGMTNYRTAKHFKGLMDGDLVLGIDVDTNFTADAELDYQGFSDIPGMTLDGAQLVKISPKGNGSMGGTQLVSFAMEPGSTPFLSAEVDYSDVVVKHGFGSSGTVALTTDAGVYAENVEDVLVVDFRGLLPPDESPQ